MGDDTAAGAAAVAAAAVTFPRGRRTLHCRCMGEPTGRRRRVLITVAACAALLVVAAVAVALLRAGRGAPIERLELVDLPTPDMVAQLAQGLGRPYVIELPKKHPTDGHDLRLEDTSERSALRRIEKLDPRFRSELRPGAIVYRPREGVVPDNPYEVTLPAFSAEGGAATGGGPRAGMQTGSQRKRLSPGVVLRSIRGRRMVKARCCASCPVAFARWIRSS